MERTAVNVRGKINLQELVITGIFIALTLVFTFFINVRLPIASNGGLIHLGNLPLFIGAALFGKRTGFWAGACGMGLFDLMSGWTAWAPFTFIIVGLMGLTVGAVMEKRKGVHWFVAAVVAAGVIKVVGCYFAEWILFGNYLVPLGSIPGNAVQVGLAGVIGAVLLPVLQKASAKFSR